MGLFHLFKKKTTTESEKPTQRLQAPSWLHGLTEAEPDARLHPFEWRGKLKSPAGNTTFQIKYAGQLQKQVIVGTDTAPLLLIAYHPSTGEEILLFDACKHGYNAMFCDTFTAEQTNRTAAHAYYDKHRNDTFEIIISTFYNADYENELADMADEKGMIELINGKKISLDEASRNGFDTLQIWVIDQNGKRINIVSEELA